MPSLAGCSLLAPTCWILLAACCVQRCLPFRHIKDSLSKTIYQFEAARRDIAIVLPLELSLQIRGPRVLDYNAAVDRLLDVINRRRGILQKIFNRETHSAGYQLSTSRRISLDAGKFTFYFHAAFLGTSRMTSLSNRMADSCNRNAASSASSCSDLLTLQSVVLYNLLLLGTFKYLPKDGGKLNDMFTDFVVNGTGFVVARNSDVQDVHHLMCRELLHCGTNLCNLTKVMIPWDVTTQPQWRMYDNVMNINAYRSAISDPTEQEEFSRLMSLSVRDVFGNSFNATRQDFGVYRSWCDSLGQRCSPCSSVTLLGYVSVLLLVVLP